MDFTPKKRRFTLKFNTFFEFQYRMFSFGFGKFCKFAPLQMFSLAVSKHERKF